LKQFYNNTSLKFVQNLRTNEKQCRSRKKEKLRSHLIGLDSITDYPSNEKIARFICLCEEV